MNGTIIVTQGSSILSKRFVKKAQENNKVVKINPARMAKEIFNVISPKHYAYGNDIFSEIQSLVGMVDENTKYAYVEKKLNDFLSSEEDGRIAIVVNVTSDMRRMLQEDYSAFTVILGEQSDKFDYSIKENDFDERAEKLFRIVTK